MTQALTTDDTAALRDAFLSAVGAFEGDAKGWKAHASTLPNGLPVVLLTTPQGLTYNVGQRWADRDRTRAAVWPADVDRDAVSYDFVTPEATFALLRGVKGLLGALKRVERKWLPLREEMLAQQQRNRRHADCRTSSLELLQGAMGPGATVHGDDVNSRVASRISLRARVYGNIVDLTAYAIPAELAAEVAEFIRSKLD